MTAMLALLVFCFQRQVRWRWTWLLSSWCQLGCWRARPARSSFLFTLVGSGINGSTGVLFVPNSLDAETFMAGLNEVKMKKIVLQCNNLWFDIKMHCAKSCRPFLKHMWIGDSFSVPLVTLSMTEAWLDSIYSSHVKWCQCCSLALKFNHSLLWAHLTVGDRWPSFWNASGRKEGIHLEDLSIDHGGFDGNMSRAKAVKLDDQFETAGGL